MSCDAKWLTPRSRASGCATWRPGPLPRPHRPRCGRRDRVRFTTSGRPSMRCIAGRPAAAPQTRQLAPRSVRSRGVNHYAMTVTELAPTHDIAELRARYRAFMDEHVYPNEAAISRED